MKQTTDDWKLATFPCMWTKWYADRLEFGPCDEPPVAIICGYCACKTHAKEQLQAGGERKMDKFWMVWNPERGMPNFRHETEASAGTEAERLARKHKGEPIYILQCIAKAVVEKPAPPPPDPVVWEYSRETPTGSIHLGGLSNVLADNTAGGEW